MSMKLSYRDKVIIIVVSVIVVLGIGIFCFAKPKYESLQVSKERLSAKQTEQQQVDDKCFEALDEVPRTALTLTVPTLLSGRRLFCIVPGSAKRDAVRRSLYEPVATSCPASILRQQAHCTLYLDAESDPDAEG